MIHLVILLIAFGIVTTIGLTLIMIKLSELTGAVGALHTKADSILSKLPALTDPPIPAEAEAGLAQLSDKLTSIDSQIPSVPPAVV